MSFLRRWLAEPEPEPEHHHSDEPVPGWDAIDAALRPVVERTVVIDQSGAEVDVVG